MHGKIKTRRWLRFLGAAGMAMPALLSGEPAGAVPAGVDHGPFDALLQAHVRDGMVDYQGFRDDVAELDRYLATLAQANLDGATREEQLAFYINAYNACTIRLILRHYGKIESIREIRKPWDTREWPLAGEVLTINEIEHQKLRDQLREPRIHFAIVCASIGCPKLASRAYTATHVDAELEAAARGFMQSAEYVRTATKNGKVLYLSAIFKWFAGDFTAGSRQTVAEFVARYAGETTAAFIREAGRGLKIRYLDYDWRLNDRR